MNKRLVKKLDSQARQKIVNGEPVSQMERIAFMKSMEKWLGPDIVSRIKEFGGKKK
jgi:hypothetical protein